MQGGRDEPTCRSVIQTLLTTSPHARSAFSPTTNAQMLPLSERPYYNQLAGLMPACSLNLQMLFQEGAMTDFAALLGIDWCDHKHGRL